MVGYFFDESLVVIVLKLKSRLKGLVTHIPHCREFRPPLLGRLTALILLAAALIQCYVCPLPQVKRLKSPHPQKTANDHHES